LFPLGSFRSMRTGALVSYCRMCSLTVECVLLLQNVFSDLLELSLGTGALVSYCRMCSFTTGALTYQSVWQARCVSSYYRMCSLSIECVLLLQNVFCDLSERVVGTLFRL